MSSSAVDEVLDQEGVFSFSPRPDQPDRYDQQESFYKSNLPGVAWLIGGNGAGTTEIALAKAAKFVLFDQPPPRKDTPFWIIAGSYEQVCEAAWAEKLYGHKHIPDSEIDWPRVEYYRSKAGWPLRVPLKPWPGRPSRNWRLEFKSYEQGRAQMQARSIGGFCFIEQFPYVLLTEVLRGCREYNFHGAKFCEFTPIDPYLSTEIEAMIEEDRLPQGWEVFRANTECAMEAGHVSEEWFHEFFGMVPPEMRETRMTGRFATYEGAIYGEFNPAVHLVGDQEITFPDGAWHRRSIDWGAGPANAFCCLWAYRTGEGRWYVYDEYYSTDQRKTTIDHLCEVQDRWPWPSNNTHYGTTYADPSSPDNIRTAGKLSTYAPGRHNLEMSRASNAVLEGIEHVQWLLKPGTADGLPMLYIHRDACKHLARQMRTYRWLQSSEMGVNPRDARPEPLKKNDHAVDALRYLLFSEAQQSGITPDSIRRSETRDRRGIQLARR